MKIRNGCNLLMTGILVGLAILFCAHAEAAFPTGVSLERVFQVKDGLSHDSVLSIAASPDMVFLGTERNLTILSSDGKVTVWGPKNSPLNFQRVSAMILRGKELWTTCRSPIDGGGTHRWDGLQWQSFEEIKDDMQSNYISCFCVDDKNTVWIGTDNQGINEFVFEKNPFRKFGYLATKKGLLDNRILCMAARPGELWIGTMFGISVYRGKDGENYLFTNYSKATGLPAEAITSLAMGSNGRVYAGSSLGLLVFENGTWRLLKKADGLANNGIKSLLVDGDDLWIGTSDGVQLYRNGVFEPVFNYRDGLPSALIQCLAVSRGADGIKRLYVGTDHGLAILQRR
ncbi:MAG: two-component regulator propeller domain-containing protein [Candidatus Ozemobacteraceae bacterium]